MDIDNAISAIPKLVFDRNPDRNHDEKMVKVIDIKLQNYADIKI